MFQYFTLIDGIVFGISLAILAFAIFKFWIDKLSQKRFLTIFKGCEELVVRKKADSLTPTEMANILRKHPDTQVDVTDDGIAITSSKSLDELFLIKVCIPRFIIVTSYLFCCVMSIILLP